MASHQTLTPSRAKNALDRAGMQLSKQQLTAVLAYLTGMSKNDAMRAAGYTENKSWAVFESANVKNAIAVILESFLQSDAAPAALRALYTIVSDDRAAPGIRVQAANSLLDRAGYDAKRHARAHESTKDVSTMTGVELQAEIDRLQQQIDARMTDITPVSVTDDEPSDSQDIDMYE